jgi:hypothetical protein
MPSVSKKQHNFMAAVAHSPAFAKKAGVPQSVGKDFTKADKGKTFKQGGDMATKSGSKVKKMADGGMGGGGMGGGAGGMPPRGMRQANRVAERMANQATRAAQPAPMPMRPAPMPTRPMGGMGGGMGGGGGDMGGGMGGGGMKRGGSVKKMAGGGLAAGHKSADGIAKKGKTQGKNVVMKRGGMARGC